MTLQVLVWRSEPVRVGFGMDAVYPAAASALARGRRLRRPEPRLRHRTMPVTFAEIKVSLLPVCFTRARYTT